MFEEELVEKEVNRIGVSFNLVNFCSWLYRFGLFWLLVVIMSERKGVIIVNSCSC